jgi:hypothetical protein
MSRKIPVFLVSQLLKTLWLVTLVVTLVVTLAVTLDLPAGFTLVTSCAVFPNRYYLLCVGINFSQRKMYNFLQFSVSPPLSSTMCPFLGGRPQDHIVLSAAHIKIINIEDKRHNPLSQPYVVAVNGPISRPPYFLVS